MTLMSFNFMEERTTLISRFVAAPMCWMRRQVNYLENFALGTLNQALVVFANSLYPHERMEEYRRIIA